MPKSLLVADQLNLATSLLITESLGRLTCCVLEELHSLLENFRHLDCDADPSFATISSIQMKDLHPRLAGGNE